MVRFYGWGFNKSTSGEISDFVKISDFRDFGDFYKFMGGGEILRLGGSKIDIGGLNLLLPPAQGGLEGEKDPFYDVLGIESFMQSS